MSEISRDALFNKLSPVAYQSVESATFFCKKRGNPYVELVHWLHQILAGADSDLHRIIRAFGLEAARVADGLTAALDSLPRGATAISDFLPISKKPSNAAGSTPPCSTARRACARGIW